MTRINLIPPRKLCREHLVAEYRELPRVFSLAYDAQQTQNSRANKRIPEVYVMGTGHVSFFYDKIGWLAKRQQALVEEMQIRGYQVSYLNVSEVVGQIKKKWRGDWQPSNIDIRINQNRINKRLIQMGKQPKKKQLRHTDLFYNCSVTEAFEKTDYSKFQKLRQFCPDYASMNCYSLPYARYFKVSYNRLKDSLAEYQGQLSSLSQLDFDDEQRGPTKGYLPINLIDARLIKKSKLTTQLPFMLKLREKVKPEALPQIDRFDVYFYRAPTEQGPSQIIYDVVAFYQGEYLPTSLNMLAEHFDFGEAEILKPNVNRHPTQTLKGFLKSFEGLAKSEHLSKEKKLIRHRLVVARLNSPIDPRIKPQVFKVKNYEFAERNTNAEE